MKVNQIKISIFAIFLAVGFISLPAYADDRHHRDTKAVLALKDLGSQSLTLRDAIAIALKEQLGLLEKACLEYDDGRVMYQIEIANDKEVYRFSLDPISGKMTENRLDVSDTVVNYLAFGLLSRDKDEQQKISSNLQTGLTSVQGKVLSIDLDYEDNIAFFEVQSLNDNQVFSNLISGRTGEVVFYQYLRDNNDHGHD